jgi:hypothetical protein
MFSLCTCLLGVALIDIHQYEPRQIIILYKTAHGGAQAAGFVLAQRKKTINREPLRSDPPAGLLRHTTR